MSESFLIKLQASACDFIKKEALTQVFFPVNFAKFLRTAFLTENLHWLLLPWQLSLKIFAPEKHLSHCFNLVCFLSQLINSVTKMNILLGVPFFSISLKESHKMSQSYLLQKTTLTFEETITTTVKLWLYLHKDPFNCVSFSVKCRVILN